MNAYDEISTDNKKNSTKDRKENVENENEKSGEDVVTKINAKDYIKLQETSEYSENRIVGSSKLPLTLHERFLRIRQTVKDAIAAHHTFMIYGKSRVVRECMLQRGWCEKFFRKSSGAEQYFGVDSSPVILLGGLGELKDEHSRQLLISRMLANRTVDFLWNSGTDWPGWPSQDNKATVFNRFYRAAFTSKVGLCSSVRQMHWYYEAGVANTLFPRCYNLCQGDQVHAFIEDFRLTGCLSLLKWLVNKVKTEDESVVRSPTGTVPLKALDFAIKRCSDYISSQTHEDIDQESEKIWSHQWDQFISWYYQIINGQTLFVRSNVPFNKYILASKHILKNMRKYWPQIDMDGMMNVWILKPGNKSRGRGIVLMNKLEDVVAKVNPTTKSDARYVVQKYIERPFLIHHTKFDIRQWFIVTCSLPLTLWMYRESYLRFCSQKFSLNNFHESVHLCNNSIQCKYNNSGDRDPALPEENMWDATTFKEYLRSQGHGEAWDELIYPGMKQGLVGSLLANQEAMDRRKNSFEMYGADFMVMDDFSVWLIEINSHPDMSYSTSVTARLCRQVMEDIIKVAVDFREKKTADTGYFELVYKQRMPTQPHLGAALSLQGTRIVTEKKAPTQEPTKIGGNLIPKMPMVRKKSPVNSSIGPVIVDLIEELEIQLDQELLSYDSKTSPLSPLSPLSPPSPPKLPAELPKATSLMPAKPLNTFISNEKNHAETRIIKKNNSASTTSSKPKFINSHNKPVNNGKNYVPKSVRKSRTFTGTASSKPASSGRQAFISKIIAHQQQTMNKSAPKVSEKLSRKDEEKVSEIKIKTAIRDAAKKYRRNMTMQPEIQPIVVPSLFAPKITMSTIKGRIRSFPKKQTQYKTNKVLTDITDMYAIGLGLTK